MTVSLSPACKTRQQNPVIQDREARLCPSSVAGSGKAAQGRSLVATVRRRTRPNVQYAPPNVGKSQHLRPAIYGITAGGGVDVASAIDRGNGAGIGQAVERQRARPATLHDRHRTMRPAKTARPLKALRTKCPFAVFW